MKRSPPLDVYSLRAECGCPTSRPQVPLLSAQRAISEVDVFICMAEVALMNDHCCPEMREERVIIIRGECCACCGITGRLSHSWQSCRIPSW